MYGDESVGRTEQAHPSSGEGSGRQEIERIEEEIQALKGKIDAPKPKDTWDKLSSISTLISGVMIALIGTVATITYNTRQQDLQKIEAEAATKVQQVQTVEKFFDHLVSEDESERKAALEILALLGNEVLVTRLAINFRDDASNSVLMELEKHPDPEVREAASEAISRLQRITVGVLDFDLESVGENDPFRAYGEALPDLFIGKLSESEDISVLERVSISRLLEEIELSELISIDSTTRSRVSRLLGAQLLLYGGFFRLRNQLYVNGHVYCVETGELISSVGGNVSDDSFLGFIENLSQEIKVDVGKYRSALLADLWYNRAKKAEQHGNNEDAMAMYAKALELDSRRIQDKFRSPKKEMGKITLAVVPFRIDSESRELMALQNGLMDLFITAIYRKNPQLKIVEDQRLSRIFEELALSQSDLVTPETQQKLGKLSVAQLIYSGKLVDSPGKIEITGELFFVERNAVIKSATDSSSLNQLPDRLPAIVEKISTEISHFVKEIRPF